MRFAHIRMPARRRFLVLAAAAAALAALLGVFGSLAAGNAADNIAVDADPAGNTATSLGTRDECRQVSPGDSVTVDITVTNVPGGTGAMIAYVFSLAYNPAVVTVTAKDNSGLLSTNPDYSEFEVTDPVPDTDGNFNANVADLNGTGISGSGFLMRLTLGIAPGAPSGASSLTLTEAQTGDTANNYWDAPRIGARLAIGQTCESLPTVKQGDVDCSGGANPVNAVDALKVLRFVAGLPYSQTPPCDPIGTGGPPVQGDVDCSGGASPVSAVDALKILRFVAGLEYTQGAGCTPIGT